MHDVTRDVDALMDCVSALQNRRNGSCLEVQVYNQIQNGIDMIRLELMLE